MTALATDFSSTTAAYRRQARRIRASFHGDSFLTQQAIGQLARRRDRELDSRHEDEYSVTSRRGNLHLEISAVVERGFCQHAGSKLQPFGFTYSDRVGLLDAGEKLGISRFRANMILAMLENQRSIPAPIAHRKPHKTIPTVLVIVAMELLVISGIVWLSV